MHPTVEVDIEKAYKQLIEGFPGGILFRPIYISVGKP